MLKGGWCLVELEKTSHKLQGNIGKDDMEEKSTQRFG